MCTLSFIGDERLRSTKAEKPMELSGTYRGRVRYHRHLFDTDQSAQSGQRVVVDFAQQLGRVYIALPGSKIQYEVATGSEIMKDFYLTLLSDSSVRVFPNNKQSNFTVKLDHPIHIEKENWQVALVHRHIYRDRVSNFFFVRVEDAKTYGLQDGQVCAEDSSCREFSIFITSLKYLVEEIQYSLDFLLKERLKRNAAIDIIYSNNSKRAKIKVSGGADIRFLFPTALAETFGVDPDRLESESTTIESVSNTVSTSTR